MRKSAAWRRLRPINSMECGAVRAIKHWLADWRRVALRECPRCDYCDAPLTAETATVDHIVPLRYGGKDETANYALACRGCNERKDCALRPEQVGLRLLRRRSSDARAWSGVPGAW